MATLRGVLMEQGDSRRSLAKPIERDAHGPSLDFMAFLRRRIAALREPSSGYATDQAQRREVAQYLLAVLTNPQFDLLRSPQAERAVSIDRAQGGQSTVQNDFEWTRKLNSSLARTIFRMAWQTGRLTQEELRAIVSGQGAQA